MTIDYKKVYKKRDGRTLVASGPRNAQVRQNDVVRTEVDELSKLRKDIEELASNIPSNTSSDGAMAMKIDEAIEEISAELEQRYVDKISTLESLLEEKIEQIKKLEEKVDNKDRLIETLTNKISAAPVIQSGAATDSTVESSRPSIDNVFIDPTSKGSEDRLESHVKVTKVDSTKPAVSDNINKLRSLMGNKLPK